MYNMVFLMMNIRCSKHIEGKNNCTWCVFVRPSLHIRREEKSITCHWMLYCTYNMLNMFRAHLCPSSGARDYMCVITAYGVRCLGCWLSEVRCSWAAGYTSGMRDVARRPSRNIPHPGRIACCPASHLQQPATKASHNIGGNNTYIV
jgi:hypothetical protein